MNDHKVLHAGDLNRVRTVGRTTVPPHPAALTHGQAAATAAAA